MSSVLAPSPSLLCKLGSIAVHAQELTGPGGHEFDLAALQQLYADAEVKTWLKGMGDMAMLPVKRTAAKGKL